LQFALPWSDDLVLIFHTGIGRREGIANRCLNLVEWCGQASRLRTADRTALGSPRKITVIVAGLISMLLARPMAGVQHPVPLAANTDAAKCLECHTDKT